MTKLDKMYIQLQNLHNEHKATLKSAQIELKHNHNPELAQSLITIAKDIRSEYNQLFNQINLMEVIIND